MKRSSLIPILLLSSAICAQEKDVSPSSKLLLRSNNCFPEFIRNGDTNFTISNYISTGWPDHSNYQVHPDAKPGRSSGVSNTIFKGLFESAKWNKLQLGVGFYSHARTWNKENAHEQKFPHKEYAYLSDIYLKYDITDNSMLQIGRFNVRDIANHLDPQYGQAIYIKSNEFENITLKMGVIDRFASFFNDFVSNFWKVNSPSRYNLDNPNAYDDLGKQIFFFEAQYNLTADSYLNPYIYHQENYVNWYGLDIHLGKTTSWGSYGTKIFLNGVDALYDTADGNKSTSFNFSVKPFVNIGNFKLDIGYARFGENEYINRPSWAYRYLTNIQYHNQAVELFDNNPLYGASDTNVYFTRLAYIGKEWSTWISGGIYRPDSNSHKTIDEVHEFQIGASVSPIKNFDIGGRFVDMYVNTNGNATVNPSNRYFELWMSYNF